ncbi:hypothetical protein [Parvularcula maris]|uniref:Uncharacterized protein n=1 Tax=Parvularcula maris TaxID=2965077 RepID=A0A9X2LAA5_9PROT|nr:hypothetical protein [Parvularcula maris]MCQ8185863.1 hypothetical protein [Parvularcula maris]
MKYPYTDIGSADEVSDEDILRASAIAFGKMEAEPFDEIKRVLSEAGLNPKVSIWSNL